MFSSKAYLQSDMSHPLETLQRIEKQLLSFHVSREDACLIDSLQRIQKEYSSICRTTDKVLPLLDYFLDELQTEEIFGSLHMFSGNDYLIETLKRLDEENGSLYTFLVSDEYWSSEAPDVASTLKQSAEKIRSFLSLLDGYHFSEESRPPDTLRRIEEDWGSFSMFSDEYLSKLSHLRQTLQQTEDECSSFHMFLNENHILEGSDFLHSLQHIVEEWGSFREYSDECRSKISNFLETPWRIKEECHSFLIFFEIYLFSEEPHPRKTLQLIEEEWGLSSSLSEKYLSSLDVIKFLERDFKFMDIILNLYIFTNERDAYFIFTNERDAINKVRKLFRRGAADFVQIYTGKVRPWSPHFHDNISELQREFWKTKLEIRKSEHFFYNGSFRLLANKDGITIVNFVMEYIETVAVHLRDLQKFDDPNSSLCVWGLVGQIEKALKELKFLNRFVCFVSDRCIEPQVLLTFLTHVLEVAWYTIMVTWLYLPSYEQRDEEYSLFSTLIQRKFHPTASSIRKIYIDVLQALRLVQSQWYPVIRIEYAVDCEVGFVETLLHKLEELPFSSDCKATKATLLEMLNFLRANLIDLPIHAPEFHLQDIDSAIVEAGLLVYSLINSEKDNHDFPGEIQRVQAVIYLITRKTYFLRFNLPAINGLGSVEFILENVKELQSLYSNSIDSIKRQLQTIQKELACFQAVVEQQDGDFAEQTNWLVNEVKYLLDAPGKRKYVPDWCLLLWILNIGEDIRVLMAEVAEVQEKNVFDLVLHNVKDATSEHNSSQFARNPGMNEEMVGLMDVMDELRGKLIAGSSSLDVISIVGMPGAGKTTLANKLYFDQSVVSRFDIRAQCCVSQEYSLKDLLRGILGDITEDKSELEGEAESVLSDKLRKLLVSRRYLIFIDDIWHTRAWEDLCSCFPDNNKGSRIILTTRSCDVASSAKPIRNPLVRVSDPLVLRMLSNDESWMLLQKKVFNEESCPLALQDIGKRIAQKCGGLPLSIVLVAGILTRMEKEEHFWEKVMTKLGRHIQAQSEDTINLSYKNLPDHLRPCFLYFGLFPEDKEIQVSKLTWLWISEGFVTTHTKTPLEDIAKDYLKKLIERNLVMVAKKSSDGEIKACRVHDLLFEFCKKRAESENFFERIKGDRGVDPSHVFPPKYRSSRRLSLHSRSDNLNKWCLSFSHVKSFQFREIRKIAFSSIEHASHTFKRFKFLRVLDFEFTMIDSIPQELSLLRYLAFRTAEDTLSLPTNLRNLETLIVQGVRREVSLTNTIWKLSKLRHLHVYDQAIFTLNEGEEFSESSSTMDDLQTISSACFSCVDNADKILEKTPNLQKLRCEVSKFDGSFPAFRNLTKLEMLKISSGTRLTWIKQLNFPSNLKKLTLSNFGIDLNDVSNLHGLEVLKLLGVTIISNKWEVIDEQFPHLKFLKLENPSFSEWDASDDAFPRLEHLVLKRCRSLKVIPSHFEDPSSLKSVEIISSNEALIKSVRDVNGTLIENSGSSGFEVFIRK